MAESFSKLPPSPPRATGRPPLYPWHEWLDGKAWKLKRGVDFTVPAASFASCAISAARSRKLLVSVQRWPGEVVYVQAFDNVRREKPNPEKLVQNPLFSPLNLKGLQRRRKVVWNYQVPENAEDSE